MGLCLDTFVTPLTKFGLACEGICKGFNTLFLFIKEIYDFIR